jgi:hypothetical protein
MARPHWSEPFSTTDTTFLEDWSIKPIECDARLLETHTANQRVKCEMTVTEM